MSDDFCELCLGSGRKYFDSGDYNMEVLKLSKVSQQLGSVPKWVQKDPRHNPLARVNSVEGQPALTKSADLPQKVKQPLKRQNSKVTSSQVFTQHQCLACRAFNLILEHFHPLVWSFAVELSNSLPQINFICAKKSFEVIFSKHLIYCF